MTKGVQSASHNSNEVSEHTKSSNSTDSVAILDKNQAHHPASDVSNLSSDGTSKHVDDAAISPAFDYREEEKKEYEYMSELDCWYQQQYHSYCQRKDI